MNDIDPENVDFLVCARLIALSDDDFVATCCVCGVKVQYPWNAPRKPKKICMQCAVEQMAAENKNGGLD